MRIDELDIHNDVMAHVMRHYALMSHYVDYITNTGNVSYGNAQIRKL